MIKKFCCRNNSSFNERVMAQNDLHMNNLQSQNKHSKAVFHNIIYLQTL